MGLQAAEIGRSVKDKPNTEEEEDHYISKRKRGSKE